MSPTKAELLGKIKILNDTVWEGLVSAPLIESWLSNFAEKGDDQQNERLAALYLLSNFMYFGSRQIRELLLALYRDHLRYRLIEQFRRNNGDTTDTSAIEAHFRYELQHTRFIGMGNPSESGCHLLYYYRQENQLPKDLFIYAHEIFDTWPVHRNGQPVLRDPSVHRYVFIDDFCGSGTQAITYSKNIGAAIRSASPTAMLEYHVLFAMANGLSEVRKHTPFHIECIHELDQSFKCFSPNSRCFFKSPPEIDRAFVLATCKRYGDQLLPDHPLGYEDGQLLIGFHHNTPDNTLPIIWSEFEDTPAWQPIFRRYPKFYGWPA